MLRVFTDVLLAVTRLHHWTKPSIHRDLKVHGVAVGLAVGVVFCTNYLYRLLHSPLLHSPPLPSPLLSSPVHLTLQIQNIISS